MYVLRCEISISKNYRLNSKTYAEDIRVVRQSTAFFYFRGEGVFIAEI
jgi:hypothetical protein